MKKHILNITLRKCTSLEVIASSCVTLVKKKWKKLILNIKLRNCISLCRPCEMEVKKVYFENHIKKLHRNIDDTNSFSFCSFDAKSPAERYCDHCIRLCRPCEMDVNKRSFNITLRKHISFQLLAFLFASLVKWK